MAIPNRPCKLAAISWRFRADLSPQNRRDFEHARILRRFTGNFFSLRVTKTYFGVSPRVVCHKHGGLACNTTSKKSSKKGESSKGSKKTWSPSEEEYLITCWAQADCLFNTCSADYKRQERKIAARVDIQRALNDQFGSTFTGKHCSL